MAERKQQVGVSQRYENIMVGLVNTVLKPSVNDMVDEELLSYPIHTKTNSRQGPFKILKRID